MEKNLLVEIRTEELPPKAGGKESLAEKYKAPVFAMFCKADFGV